MRSHRTACGSGPAPSSARVRSCRRRVTCRRSDTASAWDATRVVGSGATSARRAAVTIGDDVIMGQFVSFHAQQHEFDDAERPVRTQGTHAEGIEVGDGTWIGAKATLLDGARVGRGSVIAAGSVVRGVHPEGAVLAGVPARGRAATVTKRSVSVIVPLFNGRDRVDWCLDSVPDHAELIVVDDVSTDGAPDYVEHEHPRATLLRNDVNAGFGTTANRGLFAASGDVRVVLNSDARLLPGALEQLSRAFDDPNVGIAGPRLQFRTVRISCPQPRSRPSPTSRQDPSRSTRSTSGCARPPVPVGVRTVRARPRRHPRRRMGEGRVHRDREGLSRSHGWLRPGLPHVRRGVRSVLARHRARLARALRR